MHVHQLFKDTCSYYVVSEFHNTERVVKFSDCCSLQKRRDIGKLKRSEILILLATLRHHLILETEVSVLLCQDPCCVS